MKKTWKQMEIGSLVKAGTSKDFKTTLKELQKDINRLEGTTYMVDGLDHY